MRNIDTPKSPRLDEARLASALSDDYARRILSTCVKKARAVKDIEGETSLPQATVYRHVNQLVEQGLLVVERSAMTPDGKRFELYRSRVRYARVEFDGDGVRIAWEPVEEMQERLARIWNTLKGA